jgi:hypothetical protein
MGRFIIKLISVLFFLILFFGGLILFGGVSYCLPGFENNGPPSPGCFYSAGPDGYAPGFKPQTPTPFIYQCPDGYVADCNTGSCTCIGFSSN